MKDVGLYGCTLRRGRSFRLKFTYKADGVVLDLAGYEIRMMVKTAATDTDPWEGFDLSTETGEITVTGGVVEVKVSRAVTLALPALPKTGVYDLVLVAPDGADKTLLEGPVTLVDSVTTL